MVTMGIQNTIQNLILLYSGYLNLFSSNVQSISLENYVSLVGFDGTGLTPFDVSTTQTIPSACNFLPDGQHLLRLKDGLNEKDGFDYPNVLGTCNDGWTIIDPNQDSDFTRYFSSFQHWTDYVAGPSITDHVTWDEWWLAQDDATHFRLSPDCQTCESGKNSQNYATYYMTGNYIGCLWVTKGYCDMDPTSLTCYRCSAPGLGDTQMTGLCTHVEMPADRSVTDDHKTCVQDTLNAAPAIGTNGEYCVCYRPSTVDDYPVVITSNPNQNEQDTTTETDTKDQTDTDDTGITSDTMNSRVLISTNLVEAALNDDPEIVNVDSAQYVELYPDDFKQGTYRITEPGYYKIMEDIEFDFNSGDYDDPNADYSWLPYPIQKTDYPGADDSFVGPYSLGFFAGIAIETSDVMLDLNGYELKMSKAYVLQQRWFSIIEIGSKAFISGQGPSNFGPTFTSSSDIIIQNGILGRSSHHGIHGNSMSKVLIRGLTIKDFEIGGIQLNGFSDITIDNVEIGPSSSSVPVLGTYTQSRFMLQRLRAGANENPDGKVTFANREKTEWTLDDIADELEAQLDLIFKYYMTGESPDEASEPENYKRFESAVKTYWNHYSIPTGSTIYGIFLNSQGASVFGVGLATGTSNRATVRDVKIHGLRNMPWEAPQIIKNKGPFNDVMDITRITDNALRDLSTAKYMGNIHTDSQFALNSLVDSWDILGHTSILDAVGEWIRDGTPLDKAENNDEIQFRCNNDVMLHVTKGIFGLRIDNVENIDVSNIDVHSIHNLGELGSKLCGSYSGSEDGGHHVQNDPYETGFTGTEVHAISIVGSTGNVENIDISDVISARGDSHGLRFLGDNQVNVGVIIVKDVHAGAFLTTDKISAPYLPNKQPRACAIAKWKENNVLNFNDKIGAACFTAHTTCASEYDEDHVGAYTACGSSNLVSADDIAIGSVFEEISGTTTFHEQSYKILQQQENQVHAIDDVSGIKSDSDNDDIDTANEIEIEQENNKNEDDEIISLNDVENAGTTDLNIVSLFKKTQQTSNSRKAATFNQVNEQNMETSLFKKTQETSNSRKAATFNQVNEQDTETSLFKKKQETSNSRKAATFSQVNEDDDDDDDEFDAEEEIVISDPSDSTTVDDLLKSKHRGFVSVTRTTGIWIAIALSVLLGTCIFISLTYFCYRRNCQKTNAIEIRSYQNTKEKRGRGYARAQEYTVDTNFANVSAADLDVTRVTYGSTNENTPLMTV